MNLQANRNTRHIHGCIFSLQWFVRLFVDSFGSRRFTIADIAKPQVVAKNKNKSACDMCAIHKQILILLNTGLKCTIHWIDRTWENEKTATNKYAHSFTAASAALTFASMETLCTLYSIQSICQTKSYDRERKKRIWKPLRIFILLFIFFCFCLKYIQSNTWFLHLLRAFDMRHRCGIEEKKTNKNTMCAPRYVYLNKWAITNYVLRFCERHACPIAHSIQFIENQ